MKNLLGMRFGRLIVTEKMPSYVAPNGRKTIRWKCKCDCGNETITLSTLLSSGKTQSCGCYMRQRARESNIKHKGNLNGKKERLYGVWLNMKRRCSNPNCDRYADYGGRGIFVCDEWQDYSNFKSWALSSGYDADAPRGKCTLDRIDNDKGYSPSNCRWVDMHIQRMNQRRSEHGKI